MSTLMVASVATAVQAQAVSDGSEITVDDTSVALGNKTTAKESSVGIGNNAFVNDQGIAIGNDVSITNKEHQTGNYHIENISLGNRVYAGGQAISHGLGLGSDVTYGKESIALGTVVNANGQYSIAIGSGTKTSRGEQGIAIGYKSEGGLKAVALGSSAMANLRSVALGNEAYAFEQYDAVALGSKSVANRSGLQGNSVKTTSDTKATPWYVYAADQANDLDKKAILSTVKATEDGALGAVSVGNDNATRQIVNVAAGTALSDAVNVAQLKSVDNRLTKVNKDLTEEIGKVNGRVDTIEDQINDIKTSGSTNTTEINNIKEVINNQKDTIEKHDEKINNLDSRVSENSNSIKDLDGRVTNNTNAISDLNDRFDSQSNAISGLNTRVDRLGKEVNKVGAGAAALAGLHPLDFDDDSKLTFAAGFGSYKNEQAAAVGAFYRPNENLMFSFGTAVGNSDNMYNAGLSVRFGQSSPYEGLSKAELVSELEKQGQDIDALKAKASEVDTVKAENAALNERLAKLEALIANR